jgi:hypothetical protein
MGRKKRDAERISAYDLPRAAMEYRRQRGLGTCRRITIWNVFASEQEIYYQNLERRKNRPYIITQSIQDF